MTRKVCAHMLASRSHAPDCAELIRCATALQMISLISINHDASSSTLKTRSRPLAQKLALSAPKPGSGQKNAPAKSTGHGQKTDAGFTHAFCDAARLPRRPAGRPAPPDSSLPAWAQAWQRQQARDASRRPIASRTARPATWRRRPCRKQQKPARFRPFSTVHSGVTIMRLPLRYTPTTLSSARRLARPCALAGNCNW